MLAPHTGNDDVCTPRAVGYNDYYVINVIQLQYNSGATRQLRSDILMLYGPRE